MNSNQQKKLLVLTILGVPGLGRVTARKIMNFAKEIPTNLHGIEKMLNDYCKNNQTRNLTFNHKLLVKANDDAKEIIEKSEKYNTKLILIEESNNSPWTKRLSHIPNAPIIIYTKGNEDCLDLPSITIIGSRVATDFGIKSARKIANKLATDGYSIVSGLALGCDISAHKGALDAGGKTVAVLANGLDSISPKQHTEIAEDILIKDGCLISEYPIGTKPIRSNFIERNRLQSALGIGLIVIETTLSGGSMTTVDHAKKQGKEIACLDHDFKYHHIDSVMGNRKLIQDNITPIKNSYDLQAFLSFCEKSDEKIQGHNQLEFF